MVKKMVVPIGLFLLACFAVFTGCNQAPAPAYPKDGAAMVIHFPVPTPAPKTARLVRHAMPQPKDVVYLTYGLFEYVITSGSEAVSGSVSISSGVTMGTVSIPLPHDGTWLVSAEWFDYGSSPRFVGATQALVNGLTNVLIDMADISSYYGCSYSYLDDTTSCYYGSDLLSFDSHLTSQSTNGGVGDIQAFFDATNGTEYLTAAPGSTAKFTYLGNGDWLNFTQIPSGTTYYADTEAAKNAAGAGMAMSNSDVYAVEMGPNYHVWIHIDNLSPCTGAEVSFTYRVNSQGFTYMKYDSTTYDRTYCTNLCYSCAGS